MRWLRVLAVVLVALGALAYTMLGTYGPPPVDPAWALEPSREIPNGAVTVRFTGTSTLVFSDGETMWLTDGWFSRPGPLSLFYGEIEPDVEAIERGLARNELHEAAAVFPVHSHFDHAMDAPEAARRTGALLLGSESTANIGRGWGLPESQIRVVADRVPIPLGRFTLTPIESRHFEFPDPAVREQALGDPDIREPLVPPAGAFDYKVGKVFPRGASERELPDRGERGLRAGRPRGPRGGRGLPRRRRSGLADGDLPRGLLARDHRLRHATPRRVMIHFDSLVGPIEGPFTGEVRAGAVLSGGSDRTLAFLREKARAHPELEFATLPRYAPVVLFGPNDGGRP